MITMRHLLFLLLAFQLAYAAIIYGDIYEGDTFSYLNNTMIRIEGPLSIQFLAHQNYSTKLPFGMYSLSASSFAGSKCEYYSEEKINLSQDYMHFDLVLLPCELQQLIPQEKETPESSTMPSGQKQSNEPLLLLIAIFLLAVIAYLFYRHTAMLREMKKAGTFQPPAAEERMEKYEVTDADCQLDEDSHKILGILKSSGGRMLQKELRQIMGASQSNLSLILTELEHLGYIKRFKRGRENLLKLVKEPPEKT